MFITSSPLLNGLKHINKQISYVMNDILQHQLTCIQGDKYIYLFFNLALKKCPNFLASHNQVDGMGSLPNSIHRHYHNTHMGQICS